MIKVEAFYGKKKKKEGPTWLSMKGFQTWRL